MRHPSYSKNTNDGHRTDSEPVYGLQTAALMRLFLARYLGVPQEA